jgi:hypothetical protein
LSCLGRGALGSVACRPFLGHFDDILEDYKYIIVERVYGFEK